MAAVFTGRLGKLNSSTAINMKVLGQLSWQAPLPPLLQELARSSQQIAVGWVSSIRERLPGSFAACEEQPSADNLQVTLF